MPAWALLTYAPIRHCLYPRAKNHFDILALLTMNGYLTNEFSKIFWMLINKNCLKCVKTLRFKMIENSTFTWVFTTFIFQEHYDNDKGEVL